MTGQEAERICIMVAAGFPNAQFSGDTIKLFAINLMPLPFARCFSGVQEALMNWKFPPALSELLVACGIDSVDSHRLLMRAISDGGQVIRCFDESGQLVAPYDATGWAYLPPGKNPTPMPAGDSPRWQVPERTGQVTHISASFGGVRMMLKQKREEQERAARKAVEALPS